MFRKEPTAEKVCSLLDRAVEKAGRAPRHMVSDQGMQFRGKYRKWCGRNGVKPRFGAIGKHGSIALIERFIKSLKDECLRLILVPFSLGRMEAELSAYALWYNGHRPHVALQGATPDEVREGRRPACQGPRLEPRPRCPLPRGDPTVRRMKCLHLQVSFVEGRRHLPVFGLREAA